MPSIVIVSGCPGSGKTTLSKILARSYSQGLHLFSDVYYHFLVHRVDPTLPESEHQNSVVMRALARSARAFAEGGYDVVVDGVIGPWYLPIFRQELTGGPPLSYLVLQVPEAEAVRRARARQGPGLSPAVRQMAGALADLEAWADHGLAAGEHSPEALADEVLRGLRAGRFAVRCQPG